MSAQHQTAKTSYVKVNDVTYAYRKLGEPNEDGVPLLFLHHFRGTMDLWDPLLVNLLSAKRQIILFDNAGVGQSTGQIPDSIAPMANHVYRFLRAVEIPTVDIFGFSMGGMIAQQLALDHPEIVRKLILSGTGPGVGPNGGTNVPSPNSAAVGELATTANVEFDAMYTLFFYPTETSKAAARQWWKRSQERSSGTSGEERSYFVQGQGIMAQGAALAKWNEGEGKLTI